ncbi:MAG TPA: hypothetical protein VKS79_01225 [Gemmataceae bacterium]|nr:hypothetical protein [Gemmataceae bacterium]
MATLLFADLEMLRQALTDDVVPPPVSRSPAQGSIDSQGRVWLQPAVPLSGPAILGLQRLGVRLSDFEPENGLSLRCWQQLIPLQRQPAAAADVALLIEMPAARMPALAAELRRLGSTGLEFRWWQQPQDRTPPRVGDFAAIFDQHHYEAGPFGQAMLFLPAAAPKSSLPPDDDRVLLRLPSAPVPIRLRIAQGELIAYWEQAPSIWVEANFAHPQVEQIELPTGQIALLRHNQPWVFLAALPFFPELTAIPLPPVSIDSKSSECANKQPVTLSLKLEEYADVSAPELWVVHERPLEQLADWVQSAGESLLGRLEFALAEPRGRSVLLLRVKPSKQPPPVLTFAGLACRSYLHLPNLYGPCGMRLAPPLRSDIVRQHLAADDQRVYALLPAPDGGFVPVSIPESAFQPLARWVEHRVPQRRRGWTGVVGEQTRMPACFTIKEEGVDKAQGVPQPAITAEPGSASEPPAEKQVPRHQTKSGLIERLKNLFRPPAPVPPQAEVAPRLLDEAIQRALPDDTVGMAVHQAPTNSMQARRLELERQLLECVGSKSRSAATSLWPELAAICTQTGRHADAAICWLNAIWEHETPPAIWYRGWLQAEKQAGRLLCDETELSQLLEATPSPASARLLAAVVMWQARHGPPAELRNLAGRIRHVLNEHEAWLPLRAAWLAQKTLAQLSGSDELALRRCRDRLYHRLGPRGLNLEQDVPSFLRFGEGQAGGRGQTVRDWLPHLRDTIQRWHGRLVRNRPADYVPVLPYPDQQGACTRAYIDLMLAWGMARLGEENSCRHLWTKSREVLERFEDREHRFLLKAFGQRIAQTLDGKSRPAFGNEDLDADLETWQSELADERLVLARYRVDALRQQSRILQPKPLQGGPCNDPCESGLPDLAHLGDADELVHRARELLVRMPDQGVEQQRVLDSLFRLAPRLDNAFARDLLQQADYREKNGVDPLFQVLRWEQKLLLATQFGLKEVVSEQVGRLLRLFEAKQSRFAHLARCLVQGAGGIFAPVEAERLEGLPDRCLTALQHTGMHTEGELLRAAAEQWILQGVSLGRLRAEQPGTWPMILKALLGLGLKWSGNSLDSKSQATLSVTRQILFREQSVPTAERTALACTYVRALGQAPIQFAQQRIEELFTEMDGLYDSRKTNTHFALCPLLLVDAVVTAIINEEFALNPTFRHWLDDQEFSVRRRIEKDLEEMASETPISSKGVRTSANTQS